jgi:hypothetical protein
MHPETLHARRLDRPQREEEGQPGHTRRGVDPEELGATSDKGGSCITRTSSRAARGAGAPAFTGSAPLPARDAGDDAARSGS